MWRSAACCCYYDTYVHDLLSINIIPAITLRQKASCLIENGKILSPMVGLSLNMTFNKIYVVVSNSVVTKYFKY